MSPLAFTNLNTMISNGANKPIKITTFKKITLTKPNFNFCTRKNPTLAKLIDMKNQGM